jgi:hypothetical protein
MSDEFYTYIALLSNSMTPDYIDSIIGMKCDESHRIGDLRKPTIIKEKENAWIIKSRLARNMSLQDHITDLIFRVSPIKEKISYLATQHDIKTYFVCVIFTSQRPSLFFTPEQLETIYKIKAQLDIDLYFIP